MDVDAVEHGAADAIVAARDRRRRAGAAARGITVPAAGAGVGASDEHEVCREDQRAGAAGDGDDLVFERLAEHFEHACAELRQLVEEEHAAVRERDLAGAGPVATADEAGVANRVVLGAGLHCVPGAIPLPVRRLSRPQRRVGRKPLLGAACHVRDRWLILFSDPYQEP